MLEFNHDTGLEEISINGKVTVWLNLTDIDFCERVFNTFSAMDAQQEKYQAMLKDTDDPAKLFETARSMDADMKALLNTLFETDVCTPLYGKMNIYAMAGGTPVWFNLVMCLIENMDDVFKAEKLKTNPRLQKYLDRFGKKK